MMGVPGGPPPPDAPFEEAIRKYRHITALHPKSGTTSAECATFHDAFSPRMHQERVMSKASETKDKNIIDLARVSTPQTVIIYHLIILTPLQLAVQLSVETMTHNTTITGQTKTSKAQRRELKAI